MSAVPGRCAVVPHVTPETAFEPRSGGPAPFAGRRRTLPGVLATTLVALALAAGGAPVASAAGPDNAPPTAEDVAVQTGFNTAAQVPLSGEDPDGDSLTFAVVNGPRHGTLSGTAPDLTFTPEQGYSGSDSFTYTANDATAASASATVSINVYAPPAPEAMRTTPTNDFVVDKNSTHHSRSITSKTVQVAKNDELLVAFVSVNGPASKAQSVTKITGGNLTWTRVERGNAGLGTSEVWQAYANQGGAPFRVKATFARSGYSAKITIAGFSDASNADNATAHASGRRSAPSVTITPQHTNSLVWAAGRVVGERYDPRPATGTRIVHDVGISHPRVGYWVQKASTPTTMGQPVTISDNIATSHRWGLTAVEIQGAVYF